MRKILTLLCAGLLCAGTAQSATAQSNSGQTTADAKADGKAFGLPGNLPERGHAAN